MKLRQFRFQVKMMSQDSADAKQHNQVTFVAFGRQTENCTESPFFRNHSYIYIYISVRNIDSRRPGHI